MNVSIIAAIDQQHGIGKHGGMAWHLPQEYAYFCKTTKKTSRPDRHNMVIMGHRSWKSLRPPYQPLPDRLNVVLTRQPDQFDARFLSNPDVCVCRSFDQALKQLANAKAIGKIEHGFVIGGGDVYQQAIHHPCCHRLYITHIDHTFDCDVFFPSIPNRFSPISRSRPQQEDGISYQFVVYER